MFNLGPPASLAKSNFQLPLQSGVSMTTAAQISLKLEEMSAINVISEGRSQVCSSADSMLALSFDRTLLELLWDLDGGAG